jgi:hypothetical protein
VPDYTAVFLPGLTVTFIAASNITGGDPVEVAGSGAVQKCTAGPDGLGSLKYVGVAGHDTTAGLLVTVIVDRVVHDGTAEGAVIAGDLVMASAVAGKTVTSAPATASVPGRADVEAGRAVIGLALTTASDGTTVRWMQK